MCIGKVVAFKRLHCHGRKKIAFYDNFSLWHRVLWQMLVIECSWGHNYCVLLPQRKYVPVVPLAVTTHSLLPEPHMAH